MSEGLRELQLARFRRDAVNLREQMGIIAASIAETEDSLADTLDRIARGRPHDASRLRALADRARMLAILRRDQAASYGYPEADAGS